MVSLLRNNLSEENAMNLQLENGDSARVRYKRRSVSAVRDFPPGCGPDAPRIDVNPHEIVETESVRIEVDDGLADRSKLVDRATGVFPDVRDNPLECGSILSLAAYFLNSIGGLKSVVGSLILKSYQILNVNVVQIL